LEKITYEELHPILLGSLNEEGGEQKTEGTWGNWEICRPTKFRWVHIMGRKALDIYVLMERQHYN